MQTMGRSLLENPKKALPKDTFGASNDKMRALRTVELEDQFAAGSTIKADSASVDERAIMGATFNNQVKPLPNRNE